MFVRYDGWIDAAEIASADPRRFAVFNLRCPNDGSTVAAFSKASDITEVGAFARSTSPNFDGIKIPVVCLPSVLTFRFKKRAVFK